MVHNLEEDRLSDDNPEKEQTLDDQKELEKLELEYIGTRSRFSFDMATVDELLEAETKYKAKLVQLKNSYSFKFKRELER